MNQQSNLAMAQPFGAVPAEITKQGKPALKVVKNAKPEALTVQKWVAAFVAAEDDEQDMAERWVELSLQAPKVFGVNCFVKHSDDYAAMRTTLESAYKMPDAPERSDKSAEANIKRAKRKAISSILSVQIARMTRYVMPIPQDKAKLTLAKACEQFLVTLQGKPATKTKQATEARIKGVAPAELVNMLKAIIEQAEAKTK